MLHFEEDINTVLQRNLCTTLKGAVAENCKYVMALLLFPLALQPSTQQSVPTTHSLWIPATWTVRREIVGEVGCILPPTGLGDESSAQGLFNKSGVGHSLCYLTLPFPQSGGGGG